MAAEMDPYSLPIFLVSVISILLLFILRSSSSSKSQRLRLPPTPFAFPIIRHLHLLAPLPHQALHKLSTRYGPIFRFSLGSVPFLAVSSPEMAKEILRTKELCFLDRPTNTTIDLVTYGSKDFLFAPYDSHWRFMKKLVMSELLNTQTLNLLLPVRKDEVNLFIKSISQKAKLGEPMDVKAGLLKLTNNVISRMIMGIRSEDDNEAAKMVKLTIELTEVAGSLNLADYIWFFKYLDLQGYQRRVSEIHRRYDDLIERIITEHQEKRRKSKEKDEEAKDLLDNLLKIYEDDTMEMKLTKDNIKGFIQNLFVAGTDTTALAMEWTFAELINHPIIVKKAVEEIDRVVGKTRLVEASDIPNLPYLQAIVKEGLRLHPPGPLNQRKSTEDCTVGGYHIPAKTNVFVNLWAIGRDPKIWEDPLEFKPERFEDSHIDVKGQHFQMLQFGSGRRMCPGTSHAMQIIHMTLGAMVQCFEWNMGPVDMEEGTGLTLPRLSPLVCVPVARFDDIHSIIQYST